MSLTNEVENHPSWKDQIRRLPSWVRGGLDGALLFILISLPIGIAFWVTDERLLIVPLSGLLYLGIPPLLFVIIGALFGSRRKNIITLLLVLVLFILLSGTCIFGAVLGCMVFLVSYASVMMKMNKIGMLYKSNDVLAEQLAAS